MAEKDFQGSLGRGHIRPILVVNQLYVNVGATGPVAPTDLHDSGFPHPLPTWMGSIQYTDECCPIRVHFG